MKYSVSTLGTSRKLKADRGGELIKIMSLSVELLVLGALLNLVQLKNLYHHT
jgi:hypothetical protein